MNVRSCTGKEGREGRHRRAKATLDERLCEYAPMGS